MLITGTQKELDEVPPQTELCFPGTSGASKRQMHHNPPVRVGKKESRKAFEKNVAFFHHRLPGF